MRTNKGQFIKLLLESDFRTRSVLRLKDNSLAWINGFLAVANDPNLEAVFGKFLGDVKSGRLYRFKLPTSEGLAESDHPYLSYEDVAEAFSYDLNSAFELWTPSQKRIPARVRRMLPTEFSARETAKIPAAIVRGDIDYYLNPSGDLQRYLRLGKGEVSSVYYADKGKIKGLAGVYKDIKESKQN